MVVSSVASAAAAELVENGYASLQLSDDANFNEIFVGEVPRPCEESTLVDIMVSDDYLSIVSFDHTQAKFPSYICTYDLTEPKLISAIGLKEAIPPSFLMP